MKHPLAWLVRNTTGTGIEVDILVERWSIHSTRAVQQMSWAVKQVVNCVEDHVPSLLEIFDAHKPTIHGENRHACVQLQEGALLCTDHQIICWDDFLHSPPVQLASNPA